MDSSSFAFTGSNVVGSGSGLTVPLVVWGHDPPPHTVSSIVFIPTHNRLITASFEGQLIIWTVDHNFTVCDVNFISFLLLEFP